MQNFANFCATPLYKHSQRPYPKCYIFSFTLYVIPSSLSPFPLPLALNPLHLTPIPFTPNHLLRLRLYRHQSSLPHFPLHLSETRILENILLLKALIFFSCSAHNLLLSQSESQAVGPPPSLT